MATLEEQYEQFLIKNPGSELTFEEMVDVVTDIVVKLRNNK